VHWEGVPLSRSHLGKAHCGGEGALLELSLFKSLAGLVLLLLATLVLQMQPIEDTQTVVLTRLPTQLLMSY
jgi:hypothetical protein